MSSHISCYISPNSNVDEFADFLDEMEEMTREIGSSVIIGGDFNSKSKLWGSTSTDFRGERLER